jgi:hypothetical protein
MTICMKHAGDQVSQFNLCVGIAPGAPRTALSLGVLVYVHMCCTPVYSGRQQVAAMHSHTACCVAKLFI